MKTSNPREIHGARRAIPWRIFLRVALCICALLVACSRPSSKQPEPPRWREDLANRIAQETAQWPPFTILWRVSETGDSPVAQEPSRAQPPAEPRPIRVTYSIDPPKDRPALSLALSRVAAEAAARWAATGVVRFDAAANDHASPPDLSVHVAVATPSDLSGVTWDAELAFARRVGDGIEVRLNPDIPFEASGGVPLLPTLLHEFGHALGIGHAPVAESVMFGGAGRAYPKLLPADLAAVQSLYGKPSEPAPGDILILSLDNEDPAYGKPFQHLRQVAPPNDVAMGVGDTDRDGRDELLLWSHREQDLFSLWILRFDAAGRLESTDDPIPGFVFPKGTTDLSRAPDGGLILRQTDSMGRSRSIGFGERGLPNRPPEVAEKAAEIETRTDPLGTRWTSGQGPDARTLEVIEESPGTFTLRDSAKDTTLSFRAARAHLGSIRGGGRPTLVLQVGK